MNTTTVSRVSRTHVEPAASERADDAVEAACARVAPSWPLDRFIAVNPFWGLIDAPLPTVAAKLRALSGAELLMPRAFYRDAYRRGALRDEHLRAALEATGSRESLADLRALLNDDAPPATPRARVVDVVDAARDLGRAPSWRGFVVQSVSQFCAAYFDEGQATFGPARDGGLYASWRRFAVVDRSPSLRMGASEYRGVARELPATARELVATALAALGVHERDRADYLWSLLLDVNGWASWCAYRRWTARLGGGDDDAIADLLAVRLAWEWLLVRRGGEAVARRWAIAMAAWPEVDAAAAAARPRDWLLQTAMEVAWRDPVLRDLPRGFGAQRPAAPAAQAVFCIDVRSEVLRRAVESVTPSVQTLGFAGFFGVPIAYQPLGATAARPQLPGLLAPRLRAVDVGLGSRDAERRALRLGLRSSARSFKTDALSSFSFVEAMGLTYAVELLRSSLGLGDRAAVDRAASRAGRRASATQARRHRRGRPARRRRALRPRARDAPGHEPHPRLRPRRAARRPRERDPQQPHAAGLDCGACCGQTGEVNARPRRRS
ncbi:MAG: putative inorganic carbon transporter subunit DabA [Polyangiales bacterium]